MARSRRLQKLIFDRRKTENLHLIADPFTVHKVGEDDEYGAHDDHGHSHGHGAIGSAHHGSGTGSHRYDNPIELTPLYAAGGGTIKPEPYQGHEGYQHGKTEAEKELEHAEEIEEATPIELFYDLFFVANLTTVTAVQYITGYVTLISYILFFSIIWFTWLQVTLLDVRFHVDSVYERVCKAAHFAIMAGFSSVSTTWNPLKPSNITTVNALKAMCLMLILSRALLAIQYGVVMWFARKQKSEHVRYAILPLLIHVGVMISAVACYCGIYFHIHMKEKSHSYIPWFAIMLVECIVVITTSCIFKIVSFKHTHLIERLGLLTLIVLGEGIILLCKGINAIVNGFGWSVSMLGVIAASLTVIYFFWMLYFDYTPRHAHYYGTKRQQFWAVLHFPYHLAIVLAVEGLRQLSLYHSLGEGFAVIERELNPPNKALTPEGSAEVFFEQLYKFYEGGKSKTLLKTWPSVTDKLDLLGNMTTKDIGTTKYQQTMGSLTTTFIVTVTESYGVPAKFDDTSKYSTAPFAPGGPVASILKLFELVYIYFFGCLALILLVHGVFLLAVRMKKDRFDAFAIALRFLAAIAMAGMIAIYGSNKEKMHEFMASGWVIPFVAFFLFLVLIFDKLVVKFVVRKMAKRFGYGV